MSVDALATVVAAGITTFGGTFLGLRMAVNGMRGAVTRIETDVRAIKDEGLVSKIHLATHIHDTERMHAEMKAVLSTRCPLLKETK